MGKKQDDFGAGTGKPLYYNKEATRFQGKVGRQDDPLPDNHPEPDYADCRVYRSHHGALDITDFIPGKEYREQWDANGNHVIDYDEGSQAKGCTGTCVQKNTQGAINTTQYASDNATYNHLREEIGNVNGNQKELKKGGGHSYATSGDQDIFISGTHCTVSGGCAAAGYHGVGLVHNVDVGLGGTGKAKGIGSGVSNKGKALSFVRQEPDGRTIIQVMPQGDKQGTAVIEMMPDGHIRIESKSTILMKAAKPITIECPTLNIKANIKHKGNNNQSGVHKDSTGKHCCAK